MAYADLSAKAVKLTQQMLIHRVTPLYRPTTKTALGGLAATFTAGATVDAKVSAAAARSMRKGQGPEITSERRYEVYTLSDLGLNTDDQVRWEACAANGNSPRTFSVRGRAMDQSDGQGAAFGTECEDVS